MLHLRANQMRSIADAMAIEAELEPMVRHLRAFAPLTADIARDEGLRRLVGEGISRARTYQVTNPGLVRFFIEMMLHFGHCFDTDPLYPWAGAILRDRAITTAGERMTRLFEEHERYLEAIGQLGDSGSSTSLLLALRSIDLGSLLPSRSDHVERMVIALTSVGPARCRLLGEGALRALVARAPEAAAACGIGIERGVALVPILSFVFGHGFATEPTHPWIGAALTRTGPDPAHRVRCLEELGRTFLHKALSRPEGAHHVPAE